MAVRITDNHAQRLERMKMDRLRPILAAQLDRNASGMLEDAIQSIEDGSGGGVRSLPGEPPNNQTGELIDSGFTEPAADVGDEIRAAAGFSAEHAKYLEHGTSKMEPRPFVVPAAERQRGFVFTGLLNRFRETVGLK
jgi:hypothetical protein